MTDSLTEAERRRLAGRARTLHERVERPPGDASTAQTGRSEEGIEWVDEWRDRVADGDEDDFRTRLEFDDLDPESCEEYLGTHDWPRGEPLPEWVDDFEELLRFAASADPDPDRVAAVADGEVPFAEVVSVVLDYARQQVDTAATSEDCRKSLEGWLVRRLESLLAQTLFIEFKTFLARQDEGPESDVPEETENGEAENRETERRNQSRERYDEFTRALLDAGLKPFFLEYAFLARLLVRTVSQWVEAVEEFRSRLADDRAELRAEFGDGAALGTVTDLEVLGDRHGEGRAVVGVTFESGVRVAYKPRPLDVEDAFYDLLDWVNEQSELPDLATADCLTREGYGWVEWVPHEECATEAEVARYYRRAGLLVALLHALNFTDGHYENVIAKGEHPVLVDAETIAQPRLPAEKTLSSAAQTELVDRSVLRTSLLPWQVSDDENSWETSGFGTADVTFDSVALPEFSNVNTDAMELEFEGTYSDSGENLPRRDGEIRPPSEHVGEIERGFEQMYEFVCEVREDLLAADGPLESLADVELRYVHRSTHTYGSVLKSLREPKYLRTGLKFGCKVEALAEPFCTGELERSLWPIYECERTALTRGDVPRFSMATTDTDLRFDGRSVAEFTERTPLGQIRDRIRDLDRADSDEQREYLRLAFGGGRDESVTDEGAGRESVPEEAALSPAEVRQASERVADRIAESAVRNRDGAVTWYLRDRLDDGGIYLRQVDATLYSGRVGVGVFLAAASRVLGDERDRGRSDRDHLSHHELAAEVVAPVRDRLRSEEEPFADLPVGGATGVGSVAYGLGKMGALLGDDRYVEDARRAAESLTRDRIRSDETYDVVGGAAGAALSLLALYDATGDRELLERAAVCGDHLLSERTEADDGNRVWLTVADERALTGFSHGASGIAYALVRLADATGERRFESAAREALEFERSHYSPAEQNWRDRRSYPEREFGDAWCHGRSGVGLARAGTYDVTGDEQLREELERALDGLDATVLTGHDHVCCGNFGRVAFALEAGRILGSDEQVARARRLTAAGVRRAESRGRFAVEMQTDYWANPAFFSGEAGIGYQLLRLESPDLPCVLRWE